MVRCPRCGNESVDETDSGDLTFEDIDLDAGPDFTAFNQRVFFDETTDCWVCVKCGFEWRIVDGKPREVIWHFGNARW